jgi:hypothetical protein
MSEIAKIQNGLLAAKRRYSLLLIVALARLGQTGQLARAGKLTMGSSLKGAMVSSVM